MEGLLKLFELADLLSDAVFIHDFNNFIYVNNAACEYLGYAKDEIIGQPISKIVYSDNLEFLENIIKKIKEEKQLKFLSKHLSKFGELIDVEVSVRSVDVDNKSYAISLVRDIRNRIKREQTSSLRLNLFDYAKYHTINDIITFALDEIEKILLSKISFLHFVEPDQTVISLQAWSTATKEKYCKALPENYHYRVDKAGIWADCVRYKKSIIHNDYKSIENKRGLPAWHVEIVRELVSPVMRGDKVVAIVGVGNKPFGYTDSDVRTLEYLADIVWEIVEKKRLEERLQIFNEVIEQNVAGVVIADINGDIEYVNPTYCRMTGYEKEELIGSNPRIVKSGIQDKKFYENMWNTLLSGKSFTAEIVNKRKNGELYSENTVLTPIVNEKGNIYKIVAVKEDITEKKKLQEQLEQTQKLEAIGQLAGGIAHDFNNILSAIMGYVELARLQLNNIQALPAYLDNIMAAADRAAGLTEKLLIFARKKPVVVENINMADVVYSFESMLKRLIGEEIEIIISAGENISYIKGNKGQIEQILLNLCINAKDAINGLGKIIIKVEDVNIDDGYCRTHSGFRTGKFVCLSVTDNGCGMDKEIMKNIFEPFFTTKAVGKGTGLGLATVYGIVKQHDGFINVYSEIGMGTTFKIYFPSIEEDATVDKKKQEEKYVIDMKSKNAANILLVEDDDILFEAFEDTLNKIGYNVFPANSPGKALNIVAENGKNIDLVITDVIMPGMNGKALVEAIKGYLPNIKVIFMSGYNEELVSERGIFVDEVKFLQKPFTLKQLISIISEILSNN